jgi:hypothetical protein
VHAPAPKLAAAPAVAPPIAEDEPVDPPAPEIAPPAPVKTAPVVATRTAPAAAMVVANDPDPASGAAASGSSNSGDAADDAVANADPVAADSHSEFESDAESDIPAAVGDGSDATSPDDPEIAAGGLAAAAASDTGNELASAAASPPSKESSSGSPMSIPGGPMGVLAAVLLVGFVAGFAVVRRRRPSDADVDVSTLFSDPGPPDDRPVPKDSKQAFSMETPPREAPAAITPPQPTRESPGAAPGIFDDELEEKEAMTMDNMDLTMGSTASEAPTRLGVSAGVDASTAGASGSNIVRIIQDMESRIAGLEARLDESIEARQQLERQVSAQTEELRVQRAAIARTQRALRSLNRSDEEQATEPALRNPETPPSS